MHDIRLIRENPAAFDAALWLGAGRRPENRPWPKRLIAIDSQSRRES
jgi:hypothetical protein